MAIESLVVVPIAYWVAIRWYVSSWPDFCSLILGPFSLFSSYLFVGLGLDFLIVFAAAFGVIRGASWLIKRRWSSGTAIPA